eukprot:m.577928 g.577928  ORF g.577928 m.577928 type:complete len:350 (+) comp22301_c0_seq15:277-1326(+)
MLQKAVRFILAALCLIYFVVVVTQWTLFHLQYIHNSKDRPMINFDWSANASNVIDHSIANHNPMSNRDTKHVAILSAVRNAAETLRPRLKDIASAICTSDISASLFILESNSNDNSRAILTNLIEKNPILCPSFSSHSRVGHAFSHVEILDEVVDTEMQEEPKFTHSEDRRVQKLSRIRDYLRDTIADYVNQRQRYSDAPKISVVMVVDLDLLEYPTAESIRSTIRRAHYKEYTVQCANGKEVGQDNFYYDMFATVMADGTMPFRTIMQPNTPAKLAYTKKKALTEYIDRYPGEVAPVWSCFGGMYVSVSHQKDASNCQKQTVINSFQCMLFSVRCVTHIDIAILSVLA